MKTAFLASVLLLVATFAGVQAANPPTGFSVYVLRQAGQIPAVDARIRKAVTWLKPHQHAEGYWYTRSPKNSDELSTYVGTAYAVLALKLCGEIP